jgi:hypothetical protein
MNDDVLLLAGLRGNSCTLESFNIKTDFDIQGNGLVWYARPQLFFNCTLCPTGAEERSNSHKEVSLVYFSCLSNWPLTVSCSELACPCYMTLPSTRGCPASTSAQWQTSWSEHPWFHASLAATAILLFRFPSRMISVLGAPQLTHSEIGATAADSMRWTFGWKNQEWACQREQDQSSWDEEAAQRRGRLWGCRRQCRMNRQSVMSFMTRISWYDAIISYTKSYYIKSTWNIYDIITEVMISYMITDMISSFNFIWYWSYLWYHTFFYDIINNIIYMILCMILQYDRRDRLHDIANDIIDNIIWYEVYWKIQWCHRKLYDIIYDIEYDIDFLYHMIFINLEISNIS